MTSICWVEGQEEGIRSLGLGHHLGKVSLVVKCIV